MQTFRSCILTLLYVAVPLVLHRDLADSRFDDFLCQEDETKDAKAIEQEQILALMVACPEAPNLIGSMGRTVYSPKVPNNGPFIWVNIPVSWILWVWFHFYVAVNYNRMVGCIENSVG